MIIYDDQWIIVTWIIPDDSFHFLVAPSRDQPEQVQRAATRARVQNDKPNRSALRWPRGPFESLYNLNDDDTHHHH